MKITSNTPVAVASPSTTVKPARAEARGGDHQAQRLLQTRAASANGQVATTKPTRLQAAYAPVGEASSSVSTKA